MRLAARLLLLPGLVLASAAHADVQLLEAARANSASGAIERIEQGADITATDATGATALHWAVYHESVELVERLLPGSEILLLQLLLELGDGLLDRLLLSSGGIRTARVLGVALV